MSHAVRPLINITQEAIHLLTQAMGPGDTLRFLGQFSNGSGNYAEERRAMFDHLELDDIVAELGTAATTKPAKSWEPPSQ